MVSPAITGGVAAGQAQALSHPGSYGTGCAQLRADTARGGHMHETDRKGIDLPFFPSLKRLFSPPTCSPLNAFLPHLHPFLSLCELCGAVRVGSYEVSKQASMAYLSPIKTALAAHFQPMTNPAAALSSSTQRVYSSPLAGGVYTSLCRTNLIIWGHRIM